MTIMPIADPDHPNRCRCDRPECFYCNHQKYILMHRELSKLVPDDEELRKWLPREVKRDAAE